MFCSNCGKENEDSARFCGYCGSPMEQSEVKEEQVKKEDKSEKTVKSQEKSKKKKSKLWVILCLILLLLAGAAAGGIAFKKQQVKKQYLSAVATGDRYLEKLDYERAETAYLEAIQIDPKKKEPYVKLIDIYIEQGEYDKAVDTAEDAKENVPEEDQKDFDEIIDKWEDAEEFTWVVKPEIEADDINYLREKNYWENAENDVVRQMDSSYAIIQKGDSYSLISLDGKLLDEMVYKKVGHIDNNFALIRKEPKYEEQFQGNWDFYEFDEESGKLYPGGQRGTIPWTGGEFYYYDGEAYNTRKADAMYGYAEEAAPMPGHAIPIRQAGIKYEMENWEEWKNSLSAKYAVYNKDQLTTEFIYDMCGSSVSGILAVEQGGKWGYADETGKIIIPIEFDCSWTYRYDMGSNDDAYESLSEESELCYAASNGFVPLVKDGKWELRRADGSVAIPSGVFEVIRPVQEGGRCWVKKDGKWGVIKLGEEKVQSEEPKEASEDENTEEPDLDEMRKDMLNVLETQTGTSPKQSSLAEFEEPGKFGMIALYQYKEGTECEVWYTDGKNVKLLFKWENTSGNSFCIAGETFICESKDHKKYVVVNTQRRVALSYNCAMIFGADAAGEIAQIYEVEGQIEDGADLKISEDTTDMSEGYPKTSTETYHAFIENGAVKRK